MKRHPEDEIDAGHIDSCLSLDRSASGLPARPVVNTVSLVIRPEVIRSIRQQSCWTGPPACPSPTASPPNLSGDSTGKHRNRKINRRGFICGSDGAFDTRRVGRPLGGSLAARKRDPCCGEQMSVQVRAKVQQGLIEFCRSGSGPTSLSSPACCFAGRVAG